MNPSSAIDRRQFVKLGALAATAAVLPGRASAQTPKQALPELPYAYDALEPHIDARTMEIHHGKHHQAYVDNFNEAVGSATAQLPGSLETLLRELPSVTDESLRTKLRNNGGGHWNHDFFWNIMAPAGKAGKPSGDLSGAISKGFGSMDAFRESFNSAATSRFGSGWAWLIVQNGQLKVVSTPNQDNPLMRGLVPDSDLGTPVLGLDVWEHAYYLNYQNRRADYVKAWWEVVNWDAVSGRFAEAAKA
jgi:superoxide dismutase, Fe-Mn family